MRRRIFSFWGILCLSLTIVLGGALSYAQLAPTHDALAGAAIVGDPEGAEVRALLAPQGGKVQRIVYFGATGLITPVVTSTPLISAPVCAIGGYTLYRTDMELSGTMTGTAPTLDVLWQNSIDGGTTWKDVGTWVQIDTTSITTPANKRQSQTVSDVYNATTAVAYGDCFRAQLQFGGTGAVGANVTIKGYAK